VVVSTSGFPFQEDLPIKGPIQFGGKNVQKHCMYYLHVGKMFVDNGNV
jgi:hypothetical protein